MRPSPHLGLPAIRAAPTVQAIWPYEIQRLGNDTHGFRSPMTPRTERGLDTTVRDDGQQPQGMAVL